MNVRKTLVGKLGALWNARFIAAWLLIVAICVLGSACSSHNSGGSASRELIVASADGSDIAYGVTGQGETTLVFVHGWLGDHSLWQEQLDHFSRNCRVAWLDLAGHGKSGAARREFTMAAFGQDVAAVCEAIGGERYVLVGHSMGGPVIIEAAELLGDKAIGVVGVDAFYTPLAGVPEEKKLQFVEWLKKDYGAALKATVTSMFVTGEDPANIDAMYDSMLAYDHDMGVSALRECIRWNAHSEPQALLNYAGKLLNINGAPGGDEQPLHESVVLIHGAGHFVFQERPDSFNAALEKMVRSFEAH